MFSVSTDMILLYLYRCVDLLDGYSGLDLFNLDKRELERLLGRDDGRHLDSLLTVQKNNAGVGVYSCFMRITPN